jgi:membrane-anchored protein YejM (alkaline phosphatase superfamily)
VAPVRKNPYFYAMEIASLSTIKKELKNLPPEELQNIIARLAKYKKENKELLSYLLFDAYNEQAFIKSVKEEIDIQFSSLNRSSFYLAKKTIRKVLKTTNKHIRFSGIKETEIQLAIYFCQKLKSSNLNYKSSRVIFNMYINQIKRINKVLSMLHEDIQFDYREEVENL